MAASHADADDALDPSIWKVASVATFGAFFSQLSATTVNVSLSSLATELHSSLSTIQWVTSGFLFALTLALPLSGWLIERMGAKVLYIWSFGAFTLSSVICAFAWSATSLIAFRLVQGMSAGILAPMAQMLLARAAGRHMARVMGYSGVPLLLAPILGPVIAGNILEYASWRWLFLMNLPIGLLGVVLAIVFLPNDEHERSARELDWVGLALLSPGLVLFLYGAERASQGIMGLVALLAGGLLLLAFLSTAKRRGDEALIALRLFDSKVFSAAGTTVFLSQGILFAGQLVIPIFLITGLGRTPTEMGWMLAPLGLGMMVTFPTMGILTKRFGLRPLSAGGALLAFVSTVAFVFFASGRLNFALMAVSLFFRGMGQSVVGIPSISAAYTSVSRQDLPMATTALNIVQRLGGAALTTLCATFIGSKLNADLAVRTGQSPYLLAVVLLCVLHACVFFAALRLPLRADGMGGTREKP